MHSFMHLTHLHHSTMKQDVHSLYRQYETLHDFHQWRHTWLYNRAASSLIPPAVKRAASQLATRTGTEEVYAERRRRALATAPSPQSSPRSSPRSSPIPIDGLALSPPSSPNHSMSPVSHREGILESLCDKCTRCVDYEHELQRLRNELATAQRRADAAEKLSHETRQHLSRRTLGMLDSAMRIIDESGQGSTFIPVVPRFSTS